MIVSDIQSGLFVLVPTSVCTAPPGVAGLLAAAGGDNRIDLTWSDDAGAGETYRVYRAFGSCPGSGFELVAPLFDAVRQVLGDLLLESAEHERSHLRRQAFATEFLREDRFFSGTFGFVDFGKVGLVT